MSMYEWGEDDGWQRAQQSDEDQRRRSSPDAGEWLTTSLNRAADYYLDTDFGQQKIADRVCEIQQEEFDQ